MGGEGGGRRLQESNILQGQECLQLSWQQAGGESGGGEGTSAGPRSWSGVSCELAIGGVKGSVTTGSGKHLTKQL